MRTRITLLSLLLTLGCPRAEDAVEKPDTATPEQTPEETSPLPTPVLPEEGSIPLEELHPVIAPVPKSGVVPEKITVQLSRPVVAGANVAVDERTVLEVEPKTTGTLRFAGPSTIELLPDAALAPDTEYRVTLRSVQIGEEAEATGTVASTFRTPEFAFVRADMAEVDVRRRRVVVELVFSGPVSPREVERRAAFTLDGGRVQARFERTTRSNVVRATLTDRRIGASAKEVALALEPGVPSLGSSAKATAGAATLEIPRGPPITIYGAHVREGASGFYVQVVCSDAAAGKTEMYFWDEVDRNSYQLSRRCVLEEEDAERSVSFEPKVDFSISPMRGGFRILANLERGSYTLRIDQDARSVDGGVTKATFVRDLSVPARTPEVSFASQGRYLPRSAWKSLAVRHLNLGSALLSVRHVPPENLIFWLSASDESVDRRNSTLILEKKIPLPSPPDELSTTWIDVGSMVKPAPSGLLELELTGSGVKRAARARLLLTDFNLVAKRENGTGRVRAFATGIHDNAPLAGVEISQVVPSGRVVSTCHTAWDGSCELAALDPRVVDRTEPFAIIAKKGDALTYLAYEELETPVDESAVQGRPFSARTPYSVAIWSDRGVYRPGETAHIATIVRDTNGVAPASSGGTGMPVVFELVDPRRKTVRRVVQETNEAGMITFDLPFADFASTGRYKVIAKAGEEVLGDYAFNVEEFVPERMKVNADLVPSELHVDDQARIQLEARYLFGGSAEGSPFEVACELRAARFSPEKNKDYEYGVWREHPARPIPLGKSSGVLAEGGLGEATCPSLTARGKVAGTARLVADVAVFESGSGRTTRASASSVVHPARFYIGLQSSASQVRAGERFVVDGIVVDWKGTKIDALSEVELTLHRIEREQDWVYDELEGRWNHREYQRLVRETSATVPVKDGTFSHNFGVAEDGGGFVVRAEPAGEGERSTQRGKPGRPASPADDRVRTDLFLDGAGSYFWYGSWGYGQDRTPRPMKPTSIGIDAPAEAKVGESVEVRFEAPFGGKALVSVETDRIIEREWLDVTPGEVAWQFELEEFHPNVYFTVLLLKNPHADSQQAFIPERAFGARSIRVAPQRFRRSMQIAVPEEVRSNAKLDVNLDLGPLDEPTYVTVAVVDEGILSLTRFESPNPFLQIFDPRALGVVTHETVGWNVLLPAGGPSGATGGDAAQAGFGRVQPIKPVALWSGMVSVPESGKATVSFDVPQYRGSLRVMAVAAGPTKMAHAHANTLVRDPLVLQTTLPRFLTSGDQIQVPVFVTNLSGKEQEVTVRVEAEGINGTEKPIAVAGETAKKQVIPAEKSATFLFDLRALAQVGAAKLQVVAEGGGHRSTESLEVPFLPAAPKRRIVQRIPLEAGVTDVTDRVKGWLPTTERSTFWVTANPYGESFSHLEYLLRYPYGCVEQTTSATRPILFLRKLIPNVDPKLVAGTSLDALVMRGAHRVLSMQTPSGGFAYWPGGTEPVDWGSAYAIHFLIDAKNLDHPIPEARIEDALDWAERRLDQEERTAYSRRADPYLHYVLSLAGRGRKAEMLAAVDELERQKGKQNGETREQLYMLKAGLFAMGDRRYEEDLKRVDLTPIRKDRKQSSWTFYSDARARGFMLSTFVDLFDHDPAGERLATLVAGSLSAHHSGWYTTQELVWGVTGLGKWVGDVATEFDPPVLKIAGKPMEATLKQGGERTWEVNRASEREKITLEVPKTDSPLYLVLSSEGVRLDASWEIGGDGLSIERDYRRADGEPVALADGSLELGEVIHAVLTIRNRTNARLQNVALVDRFPAGWEIENPRLGRDSAVDWIDRDVLWSADHANLRDDRLEVFGSLGPGEERKVIYTLRAVGAGRFSMPPAEAEVMYDPSFWARAPGGFVVVRGPWE